MIVVLAGHPRPKSRTLRLAPEVGTAVALDAGGGN
jgi:hypothetical protein